MCYNIGMATTTFGPPDDPRLAALYRVDLTVGGNGTLDAMCDCSRFIRSQIEPANLLNLVEAVMQHRHDCPEA